MRESLHLHKRMLSVRTSFPSTRVFISPKSSGGPYGPYDCCRVTVCSISLARVCSANWTQLCNFELTHWGRVTHICVGKQTIIGSDNGLSPGRRQAIIWTIAGILLIGPSGTTFSEISIKILTFSFANMRLKVSSAKWRPFCLGLNVLSYF